MSLARSMLLGALAASTIASAQPSSDCASEKKATVDRPRDGRAWLGLGLCEQKKADKAQATEAFLTAVATGDLSTRIVSELQLFKGGMEHAFPAKGCEELAAPAAMRCSMAVLACRANGAMYFAASMVERPKLKAAAEAGQPPGPNATRLEPKDCRIIVADECRGLLAYVCGPADHPRVRELDLR